MKKTKPVGAAQTSNVKFIPGETPKALAQRKKKQRASKKKLLHIPKVENEPPTKPEKSTFDLGSAAEEEKTPD